jgi:hypothetical protein
MAKAKTKKDVGKTAQAGPPIPLLEEKWYEDLFKRPLSLTATPRDGPH